MITNIYYNSQSYHYDIVMKNKTIRKNINSTKKKESYLARRRIAFVIQ